MGKTDSDTKRRLLGPIPKRITKQQDDDTGEITEGGCKYYGNLEAMKRFCPKCNHKNECY